MSASDHSRHVTIYTRSSYGFTQKYYDYNKCKENGVPRRRDQERTLNAEGTYCINLSELVLC